MKILYKGHEMNYCDFTDRLKRLFEGLSLLSFGKYEVGGIGSSEGTCVQTSPLFVRLVRLNPSS